MDDWLMNAYELVVVVSVVCYGGLLGLGVVFWKPRIIRPDTSRDTPDEVTVVIAARDEEDNLAPCIQSLLTQPGLAQVIIVDDHSSDSTRRVAQNLQAKDSRIVSLSAPALPSGWIGKSHALYFGTRRVKTPYILFTDADVLFGPGVLAEAVHRMKSERLDHLGGHFFVDCQTVAEEICAPVLLLSSVLALFGSAESQGASTGAFNLVRTPVYESCGGHTAIKREIVDDVALARHLKSMGAKTRLVGMGESLKVRLFIGFQGFMSSVRRSAVPFLRWGTTTVCAATSICMVIALMPLASLLGSLLALLPAYQNGEPSIALFLGPLPLLLGAAIVRYSRPFHNGRAPFQLLFPVPLFLMGASAFCAAIGQRRKRPTVWRGREYTP